MKLNERKYMFALGLLTTKHEDGAFIGYGDIVANNVVVDPVVLFEFELMLKLQAVDIDDDEYDFNVDDG